MRQASGGCESADRMPTRKPCSSNSRPGSREERQGASASATRECQSGPRDPRKRSARRIRVRPSHAGGGQTNKFAFSGRPSRQIRFAAETKRSSCIAMATRFARIGPQYLEHFSFNMHRVHFPPGVSWTRNLHSAPGIAEPLVIRPLSTDAIVHQRGFRRDAGNSSASHHVKAGVTDGISDGSYAAHVTHKRSRR